MKKITDLNHFRAMEEILLDECKIRAETAQKIEVISAEEKMMV
jgi:hypothetical protein